MLGTHPIRWFFCWRRTKAYSANEFKGFIENYEFPCVGVCDVFHVYVLAVWRTTSVSRTKLIAHNKGFLHLTGAPGSTHDARLLRYSILLKYIQSGGGIPNKSINLGGFGEIPLETISDTTFPLKMVCEMLQYKYAQHKRALFQ